MWGGGGGEEEKRHLLYEEEWFDPVIIASTIRPDLLKKIFYLEVCLIPVIFGMQRVLGDPAALGGLYIFFYNKTGISHITKVMSVPSCLHAVMTNIKCL